MPRNPKIRVNSLLEKWLNHNKLDLIEFDPKKVASQTAFKGYFDSALAINKNVIQKAQTKSNPLEKK